MTTLHGWQCPKCQNKAFHRQKPSKKGQFIYRGLVCRTCKIPMKPTGEMKKKLSDKEIGQKFLKELKAQKEMEKIEGSQS